MESVPIPQLIEGNRYTVNHGHTTGRRHMHGFLRNINELCRIHRIDKLANGLILGVFVKYPNRPNPNTVVEIPHERANLDDDQAADFYTFFNVENETPPRPPRRGNVQTHTNGGRRKRRRKTRRR